MLLAIGLPFDTLAQNAKENYKNSERAKLLLAETNPTVVHISVDGLRGDAVSILGSNNLPNLHKLIFEGSSTLNARADFDYTITLPNHSSQLTSRGVLGPNGHNWTSNVDPSPTQTLHNNPGFIDGYCASVFDQAHNYGLRTGLYASKSKFSIFEQSYNSVGGEPDTTGADNGRDKIDVYLFDSSIEGLTSQLIADMEINRFDYAFIHLRDPDSQGHSSGWDINDASPYLESIERIDLQLGRILGMIESDPFLRENVIVILTADHGGGDPYTSHTVNSSLVNYRIPFAIWGNKIPVGQDLYNIPNIDRVDPGTSRPDYADPNQPIRNGDAANLALRFLGLPAIPGSTIGFANPLGVGNSPFPRLEIPLDRVTFKDSTATLTLFPYNPLDAVLSYSEIGLPPGLSLDPNTGVISGAPTDYGSYEVYLEVSDGLTSSAVLMNWSVLDPPPVQLCPADLKVFPWTFDPGGNLSVSFDETSEELTISGSTRTTETAELLFSEVGFEPQIGQDYSVRTVLSSYDEVHSHTLALFIVDSSNLRRLIYDFDTLPIASEMNAVFTAQTGDDRFQIVSGGTPVSTATAVVSMLTLDGCQINPPIPEFVELEKPADQKSYRDQDLSLQLSATSPAGNTLVYSALDLPLGLQLGSQSGLISGKIFNDGSYDLIVSVSDGISMVTKAFEWHVGNLVKTKVMLQGPFDGTEMSASIERSSIPLAQPYSRSILGFDTHEFIHGDVSDDMIDWVQVELRENTIDKNILVDVAAGILLKDGSIVGPNGEPGVVFYKSSSSVLYYIVVRHRNHLAVISDIPILVEGLDSQGLLMDFTTGLGVFGIDPQTEENGVFAMWMGDVNGDGEVRYSGSNNDRASLLDQLPGPTPFDLLTAYLSGDIDLNGRLSYSGIGNDRVLMLEVLDDPSAFSIRSTQVPKIAN